MEKYISVVIPNYNNAKTIGKCLEAAYSSHYKNFEVIVIDDHSEDNSLEIIKKFPCKLVCLQEHAGASKARNIGAQTSQGDAIFFTDADCLLREDTLSIVNKTLSATEPDTVIGGTYTSIPYDNDFFGTFQSVYIHYSETKHSENPDYIAAHAMIIDSETFKKNNGFPEYFMPILEDVEFSHRLRRKGYRLIVNPEIQVQHIFNFTLLKSLINAFKKTMYWAMYSLKNKDSFTDSGTASVELKVNVVSYYVSLFFLVVGILLQKFSLLYAVPFVFVFNSFMNKKLLSAFYGTKGSFFAGLSFLYYIFLFPLPVGTGALAGIVNFLLNKGKFK
ncbi:MAG: glycosyltransferase family 2 protein [Thermodesulfovibrionia bacterium]|nr:glycosyltransferase family 2 protein [Thermodesulfovibrionia bacterium]